MCARSPIPREAGKTGGCFFAAPASGLLNGLADRLQLPVAPTLDQVQVAALLLVVAQNIVYLLALHAVAWWVLPRLRQAIPDPPRLLRPLLALDPS